MNHLAHTFFGSLGDLIFVAPHADACFSYLAFSRHIGSTWMRLFLVTDSEVVWYVLGKGVLGEDLPRWQGFYVYTVIKHHISGDSSRDPT